MTEAAIGDALQALATDPPRLAAMSRAAAAITDGGGTLRVADAIERLVDEPSLPQTG